MEVDLTQFDEPCMLYVKMNGMKRFRCFDYAGQRFANCKIFGTIVNNDDETRNKLQKWADMNYDLGLVVQMRRKNDVIFTTHR